MKRSTRLIGALAIVLAMPVLGLGAALGTASVAGAQDAGTGQAGGSVAFVRDAGNGGQFEVKSGQLALTRSEHVAVRDYATQAVKDAGEMVERVKTINRANAGAPMPPGLTASQTVALYRLNGLHGIDFNREYMRAQIEVGELLQKAFADYGATGDQADLRVYAAQVAAEYDVQLRQARTIAGSL